MAGKKLLVADDSLTIQKVIRLALSNEGYEIQAVSEGNDAIEQISVFRPDAVLIDVSLPGKTAFEVKRAINEHQDLEETRFILMSSAFEKVDESQAEEVRFHGRLTKPFDPAHLRQVLHDVLEQVAAMRREPTSLLQRPAASVAPQAPAMPPLPPPMEPEIELDLAQPYAEEPVLASPPPTPAVSELWDREPELTQLPPPLPPLGAAEAAGPEPIPHSDAPDGDIKHLTESTIRMSGLDDFEWSVSEPSLRPSPQMADTGGSTFQIEPPAESASIAPFQPEEVDTGPEIEDPSIRVLPTVESDITNAASPTDFYRDTAGEAPRGKPSAGTGAYAPPPPAGYAGASAGAGMGSSSAELEELIRKELRETFQRMAEKLLPEMAEKVIKQEIHRMLSES